MQSGLYVSNFLPARARPPPDDPRRQRREHRTTVGFRATEVKFNQVSQRPVRTESPTSPSFPRATNYLSTRAGPACTETGGALDFAIKGDAWFHDRDARPARR
jgi:flagellar basal-body rod protein FlgF